MKDKILMVLSFLIVLGLIVNIIVGLFGFIDSKLTDKCEEKTVSRMTKYVFPGYSLGCYLGEQVPK
jgi:hypothetical protein